MFTVLAATLVFGCPPAATTPPGPARELVAPGPHADRAVLVVSIDGLRRDYLDDQEHALPTLRKLQAIAPTSRIDVRRFRPNLVIATDGDGTPEIGWKGRKLGIGGASLEVIVPCPRCVMITHGFGSVPQDAGLMRTVVRELEQNVGAYARIASGGEVRVGDAVELS